jgi:hypothetical protein
MNDETILYKHECYAITWATVAVYREMGCGLLETVDQEYQAKEFTLQGSGTA